MIFLHSFLYYYLYDFIYANTCIGKFSFFQANERSQVKNFLLSECLGTIGWIVAGITISFIGWDKQGNEFLLANTFKMAAIASIILGLFSFTLPATPPLKKGLKTSVGDILGLDAIRLLKNKSYLIFFLSSIAICVPLAFYYNFTNLFLNEKGMQSTAGIQSLWAGF